MTLGRLCVGGRLRQGVYRGRLFAKFQGRNHWNDGLWDLENGELLGVPLPVSELSPACCIGLGQPLHKEVIIFSQGWLIVPKTFEQFGDMAFVEGSETITEYVKA